MRSKLSEEVLLSVDEGGDYWDGDIDDKVILRWGKSIAALEANLKALVGGALWLIDFAQVQEPWDNDEGVAKFRHVEKFVLSLVATLAAQQEEKEDD